MDALEGQQIGPDRAVHARAAVAVVLGGLRWPCPALHSQHDVRKAARETDTANVHRHAIFPSRGQPRRRVRVELDAILPIQIDAQPHGNARQFDADHGIGGVQDQVAAGLRRFVGGHE